MAISYNEMETHIGRLAMSWAMAEHALDQCISVLFHVHGGDAIERELPRNTRGKIKFFRKAAKLATKPEHSSKVDEVADSAIKCLEDRNWIIHGASLQATKEGWPDLVRLRRLARPDLTTFEIKEIGLSDISKVRDECTLLMYSFLMFLYQPLGVLPEDHVKKVFDDLGVQVPSIFGDP